MGLDVFWHSEIPDLRIPDSSRRTVAEYFWDEDDVLMDAISSLSQSDFPVLFDIDLYGDTLLDFRQCAAARVEVERIPDWKNNAQLVRLEILLRRCSEAAGTYVYIAGD
ncbi:hypothetical protein ABT263_38620 [Kitasatospora sp. NPDC001603]|uniref:hypothetical protein n=1 Tax=Kitasatospora sp. NPDC001603 TaxID=3154388 RepID=UPI0033273D19